MKNEQKVELKTLVGKMIGEYRETGKFSQSNLEEILNLVDFQDKEISFLILKFHHINTRIADNGGIPVLKEIHRMI
ncbi:hypothetical protein COL77_29415 [Bacillus wiedmannii]|uniref:hypothetical protein n=1 Tax=Bacillus wiedmannii TaxID=1890302 RepID=UPI000BF843DB|nr:hypothetical protein [Bacillus wiedmannii]PFZ35489.1 hypothetical protein COL77_29415 [Bacillus wiedmannii]PGM80951.1 hypothetical protein CN957_12865 [Bacillus cereus]